MGFGLCVTVVVTSAPVLRHLMTAHSAKICAPSDPHDEALSRSRVAVTFL